MAGSREICIGSCLDVDSNGVLQLKACAPIQCDPTADCLTLEYGCGLELSSTGELIASPRMPSILDRETDQQPNISVPIGTSLFQPWPPKCVQYTNTSDCPESLITQVIAKAGITGVPAGQSPLFRLYVQINASPESVSFEERFVSAYAWNDVGVMDARRLNLPGARRLEPGETFAACFRPEIENANGGELIELSYDFQAFSL